MTLTRGQVRKPLSVVESTRISWNKAFKLSNTTIRTKISQHSPLCIIVKKKNPDYLRCELTKIISPGTRNVVDEFRTCVKARQLFNKNARKFKSISED